MPLTNADLTEFVQKIRDDPASKQELKASGRSKQQLLALFQGLDDWFAANRVAAKTAMESSAGVSISNNFAKKVVRAWMQWRFKGD